MNKEDIKKFIDNPDNIIKITTVLSGVFPDVIYKINRNQENKDSYSYYLTGHCPSFAYILYEVFDHIPSIYYKSNHVVVKINNDYYDVRGCITDMININEYQECPIDEFPKIQDALGNNDEIDKKFNEELIKIGKEEMIYYFSQIQQNTPHI